MTKMIKNVPRQGFRTFKENLVIIVWKWCKMKALMIL